MLNITSVQPAVFVERSGRSLCENQARSRRRERHPVAIDLISAYGPDASGKDSYIVPFFKEIDPMVRVVPNHCVNVKCEFSTEECGPNVDDLAPGEKEPASPISSKPSAPVNLRKADPSQMACRCRFVSGRSAGPFVHAGEMRPGTSATRPKNV